MNHALVGVGRPRLPVLYYITVHPVRGLFAQSPVLAAALVGYAWLLRDPRWRAEGWLSLFLLAAFLLMWPPHLLAFVFGPLTECAHCVKLYLQYLAVMPGFLAGASQPRDIRRSRNPHTR